MHPRPGANDLKLTSTGGPGFYYTKKLVNFWQEFSIWWLNATNMAMKSRTNTIFYTSIVSSLFTWDVRHPVSELVHHDCPFQTLKLGKVSWINPSLTLRCMSRCYCFASDISVAASEYGNVKKAPPQCFFFCLLLQSACLYCLAT